MTPRAALDRGLHELAVALPTGAAGQLMAYAELLAIIKGEPERIAKGGQCPFGGIRLGAFEGNLVRLPRGWAAAFPST